MKKIQSESDIITNSSSEVFIVKSDLTTKELQKTINSWYQEDSDNPDNYGSGMGCERTVYDNTTPHPEDFDDPDFDVPVYPWLPDGYFALDIDWGLKKLIERIFKDLYVIDSVEELEFVIDNANDPNRCIRIYNNQNLGDGEKVVLGGYKFSYPTMIEYDTKRSNEILKILEKIVDGGESKAKEIAKLWNEYSSCLENQEYLKDCIEINNKNKTKDEDEENPEHE